MAHFKIIAFQNSFSLLEVPTLPRGS